MSTFRQNEHFANRYLLAGKISQEDLSEIWKAYDEQDGDALVAIKIYTAAKELNEINGKQFKHEYALHQAIAHPNLVKIAACDVTEGVPYVVMPFYKEGSLGNQLQQSGKFDEKRLARLMLQMGSALAALHAHEPSVLHQHISPNNILLQDNEKFLLTDYGVDNLIKRTLRAGSPGAYPNPYAPPERVGANPVITEAGDVYSLGVVLHQTCTGQAPAAGNGGQGGRLPQLPPAFSNELNKILQACTAPEWQKRPKAQAVADWGKYYLDNGHWKFELPGAGTNDAKQPRDWRKIWPYAAAAVVAVLLIAGGAYAFMASREAKPGPATADTTTVQSPPVAVAADTVSNDTGQGNNGNGVPPAGAANAGQRQPEAPKHDPPRVSELPEDPERQKRVQQMENSVDSLRKALEAKSNEGN